MCVVCVTHIKHVFFYFIVYLFLRYFLSGLSYFSFHFYEVMRSLAYYNDAYKRVAMVTPLLTIFTILNLFAISIFTLLKHHPNSGYSLNYCYFLGHFNSKGSLLQLPFIFHIFNHIFKKCHLTIGGSSDDSNRYDQKYTNSNLLCFLKARTTECLLNNIQVHHIFSVFYFFKCSTIDHFDFKTYYQRQVTWTGIKGYTGI